MLWWEVYGFSRVIRMCQSTTLQMIVGLEEITDGEIWIGDKCVNGVSVRIGESMVNKELTSKSVIEKIF